MDHRSRSYETTRPTSRDTRGRHRHSLRELNASLPAVLLCVVACGSETPAAAPVSIVASPTPTASAPVAGASSTAPRAMPVATSTAGASSMPVTPAPAAMPIHPAAGPDANPAPQTAKAEILPCGVSQTLATNCQNCHGAEPIGGAPMSLVTYADLHKPAITKPTMKVYQLSKLRIHAETQAMPPGIRMAPADTATLDTWFDSGAPPGTTADANCTIQSKKNGGPGTPGVQDGTYGRLNPRPGETCYEFKVHQSTTSVDNQPYAIGDGEHYEQFYYKAPWPTGTVATSYATITDNEKVLHHWLLFSSDEQEVEGYHKTAPLPTLIGTNPVLLAGWALGGPNMVPPDEVGMELPAAGKQLNVQWHFYNSTNTPQADASSIQICTVPPGVRKNTGSITWLGTEDLNGNVWFGGAGMPPHKESTFKSTCNPLRRGMNATDSIHLMIFEPHMHRIGKRMVTEVNHLDGKSEVIFDEPFSFGAETHYYKNYDLKPGETLTTSCTFDNTNDYGVPFGESSDSEMCYQFVYAWPAHALSNFAPSILGVTDTCW